MKKITSVLLVLLMVLAVFGLVACGSSDNEDLVGTWESNITLITFNEDGTGEWNTDGTGFGMGMITDYFTWSTSSGNLTFEFEDGDTAVNPYTLDGDTLTMIDSYHDEELIFIRV